MRVSKELAMQLWRDVFGSDLWAVDCFGTWIYRDDYGDTQTTRIAEGKGKGLIMVGMLTIFPIARNAMNNYEPMLITSKNRA